MVLHAYTQGAFPMADSTTGEIGWYEADPRAIIPLDEFHVPRRLARTIRQGKFEVRFNTVFPKVMIACAQPRPQQPSTWISREIITLYTALHLYGHAHSVECWQNDELVGGLYGVTIGGLFAGESMFSTTRDSSKVALVALVERLRERGFVLLDTQFMTDHLSQFGTMQISKTEYHHLLSQALPVEARFDD